MNFQTLKQIFSDNQCRKFWLKRLSPNDNSKNQVYMGGSFEVLNILPITEIIPESPGDWKRERFKAKISFSWADDNGSLYPAPHAQLILYPKYPEVRFSGFLNACAKAPSGLMATRIPDRLLFFGVTDTGKIIGYVAAPDSEIAREIGEIPFQEESGIFRSFELNTNIDTREKLIHTLYQIHLKQWIKSKRLDSGGNILPCNAPNCGGYTLEAELGITPNGYAEPDYLGWEIKQFGVANFNNILNRVITLMTPEPTHGIYAEEGTEAFIRKYGYYDTQGREDRMNFGGIHKFGLIHSRTNLKLVLQGFDPEAGKILSADGKIALIDKDDNEAASWSFSSLMKHWNRKHNKACYIPSLLSRQETPCYMYGDKVIMGEITDFQFFLSQMASGHVYYDPGIKMEHCSGQPKIKKRSQFRIKSANIRNLYKKTELITLY